MSTERDLRACRALIDRLWALKADLARAEREAGPVLAGLPPARRSAARNLLHYLEMRRLDLRTTDAELGRLGLAPIGRPDGPVMHHVDLGLALLHRLAELPVPPDLETATASRARARAGQADACDQLLGELPTQRRTRLIATLPAAAAHDYGLVRRLVAAGMDAAHIDCGHGNAHDWAAMATHVRRAAEAERRPVHVLVELAGLRLRTGPLPPGPAVLRLKPVRDDLGQLVSPARLHLVHAEVAPGAGTPSLQVDGPWLKALAVGDRIEFDDARGAYRQLRVVARYDDHAVAETTQSAYLVPETVLKRTRRGPGPRASAVAGVPSKPGSVRVHRGDRLQLVDDAMAAAAVPGMPVVSARVPGLFTRVRPGDRIVFDGGRVVGVVRVAHAARLELEVTQARHGGESLAADQPIALPDTRLDLPPLTADDLRDLDATVGLADMVALPHVHSAEAVHALRDALAARGANHLGVVLKIETRNGFEQLPDLLLAALAAPRAGLMIARGDLATEVGCEQMATVQQDILGAADAALLPVIWSTQALDGLAKSGRPSPAELLDAALGVHAEGLLLPAGPHLPDAVRTLHDILCRARAGAGLRPAGLPPRSWSASGGLPGMAERQHAEVLTA